MNIKVSEKNMDFKKIQLGDVVITASGEACLIATSDDSTVEEDDRTFLAVNLTYNRVDISYHDTIPELCKFIEYYLDSPIIKCVSASKVNLDL